MPTVKKVRSKRPRTAKKVPKKPTTKLLLPTTDNVPPDRLEDSVILIYGRKSIGKTSLANEFNSTLTFMFERARRNLKIRQVPTYSKKDKSQKSLSWENFQVYMKLFKNSKDYQIGVIDTIDRCYIECFNYVCHNVGIKHPEQSSAAYEIWDAIDQEFSSTLFSLQESSKGVILLSHEKAKPLVTRSASLFREGDEDEALVSRMEPSCKPAAVRVIQEVCDYVMYYCFIGSKRVICIRSDNEYSWTACGFNDHFLDPDGNPIQKFEVGNSPQQAYKSLQDAYNNKLYDIDYEPPRRTKKKKKRSTSRK